MARSSRTPNGPPRRRRVTRPTLRDQIKQVLLERIVDGTYAPGERIVEIRVAQELGVSQAPVREALRELELLRLVESEPFRGARVRGAGPEEIVEIYPVRAALEEVAAQEAAPRLAGSAGPLAEEIESMRAAAAADDVHRFVSHDVAFHRALVLASGNRTLADIWEGLQVDVRTRLTLTQRFGPLAEVAEAHVPLLEAVQAGDGRRAGRLLRAHIEGFGRAVEEGLARTAAERADATLEEGLARPPAERHDAAVRRGDS